MLLQVDNVSFRYGGSRLFTRRGNEPVLKKVSFTIEEGTCLGLIGTSGAGKSTIGRVILGIQRPQQGKVSFQGYDLYQAPSSVRKKLRRDLQVVFQDAYSAVNPRMTAAQIISEPLQNFERQSKSSLRVQLVELIKKVGLQESDLEKYPHQFSGGQLQRITIARAIALNPKLIVLDESVSSLDMVTQSMILELLNDLKKEFGLSYLFITHDIKAAFAISDRIGVLEKGELAEVFDEKETFFSSKHPAVKRLREAVLAEHPRFRTVTKQILQ